MFDTKYVLYFVEMNIDINILMDGQPLNNAGVPQKKRTTKYITAKSV